MKNKGVLIISIFFLMWILYILFEFFIGRIIDFKIIFFNIIFIIFFVLVGLCIYKIGIKYERGFKFNILLFLFCLFFFID